MPPTKLRVLFVEASIDDMQQILTKLEANEYLVEYQRVDEAETMKNALIHGVWDVVLCSYNPPAFGGLEALRLMQSLNINLPFLFLSHNLREENIIQAIQSGAGDYIFKGNLNRLVPAIEHYLHEARIRREHRQMVIDLQENQTRLHAFISNLPGMAYQLAETVSGEISFPFISDGCQDLLGIPAHELAKNPTLFHSILHPADINSYKIAMQNSARNLTFVYWEGRIKSLPEGDIKWVSLRCRPRKMHTSIQWEGMMLNISERKLAEIEIINSQEYLRELSAHIQDVREEERLSLAREVHDDMGSMLTAIKMDIAWVAKHLQNVNPALTEKINDIDNLVNKCAAAAGNICSNLRPSALDSFGIVAAIEIEAHDFERRTGIPCLVDSNDEATPVDPNIAITLFRIFQEALNNIMKHAHATEVVVSIYNRQKNITLTVKDNGYGFKEPDRLKPRSFGLRGIQERVTRFNGEVNITSKPKQGTTIAVSIPHTIIETEMEHTTQQTLF